MGRRVHGISDELGANVVHRVNVEAEVAANTLFPLLGFLGLTPKSAKVAPIHRSRPWSSNGRNRFLVNTGAGAREWTPPMGPVMLLMPPGAAELLAEGHVAALAGQEGCCVSAIQSGMADSTEAGGH